MAASLIGGLAKSASNTTLSEAMDLMVYEPDSARAERLEQSFGVRLAANNEQLIEFSDVVVLAVKPQILRSVVEPLSAVFAARQPLIISIVAGIRAGSITSWLQAEHAVVRAMPNTPALVSTGATGLFATDTVSEAQRRLAEQLVNTVGISCWVPHEDDIDSVTALSGSGPAYFMLFIKSLIEAGITAGLDRDTARSLAVQTAKGSAALIGESDQSLQTLIDNVTSPNGTTERALHAFDAAGLAQIVSDAFEAARIRSQQLAQELDASD